MKKFSFRLEPLLKMRVEKEEVAVRAQYLAQKEHQDQLGALETICDNLKRAREISVERISAGEFFDRYLYIDSLCESRVRQEKTVEWTSQELENRRQEMVEARKDKLVLQKLKENSITKYTDELNRWEAKILDDQCTVLTHKKRELGNGN